MVNIEFSPESFYILEPNGSYKPLGNITKFEEIATYSDFTDDINCISSFNMTVTSSFEEIAKLSREAIITLFGFRDAILKCCLNKRVVHLALHASKARTRKKNFNRAIRILERF